MRDETNLKPGTKKRRTFTKEKQYRANCQSARAQRIKKQHEIVLGRLRRTGYKRGTYLYRIAEGVLRETATTHLDRGVSYKEAFDEAVTRATKKVVNQLDTGKRHKQLAGDLDLDDLFNRLFLTDRKVHNEMRTAQPGKRRLLQAA